MQLKVLTFPHRISYPKALNLQLEIVSKKLSDPKTPDYLILLEHEPSITLGRRMHSSSETINSHIPIFKSPRGGKITYHGPGQLTCYPIIDLRRKLLDDKVPLSLHDYVAMLGHVMKQILLRAYGIENSFIDTSSDRLGLWTPGNRKAGFIGIQTQKWITSHGFSLNLTRESLNGFTEIDPCGLAAQNVIVTCAENESLLEPSWHEVLQIAIEEFKQATIYSV